MPCVAKQGHQNYDPDASERSEWGKELVRQIMADPKDRGLAERFAPSATNFGTAYARLDQLLPPLRSAFPDKITKLFQPCLNPGGAKWTDVGALDWQRDDITFQATGSTASATVCVLCSADLCVRLRRDA